MASAGWECLEGAAFGSGHWLEDKIDAEAFRPAATQLMDVWPGDKETCRFPSHKQTLPTPDMDRKRTYSNLQTLVIPDAALEERGDPGPSRSSLNATSPACGRGGEPCAGQRFGQHANARRRRAGEGVERAFRRRAELVSQFKTLALDQCPHHRFAVPLPRSLPLTGEVAQG